MRGGWLAALLVIAGCRPSTTAPLVGAHATSPRIEGTASPSVLPAPAEDVVAESRRKVHMMLQRVAAARNLPVQREVASRILDRGGVLARIRAHVDREIPPAAVQNEGELLAALELVPPDYDFVEGTYALIQGRIAGFYEPGDHTMYLVDDLSEKETTETLAHELDHALQDQAFSIDALLAYAPGDSDRTAAAHAIIEGDAVSATLDVVVGSTFGVSDGPSREVPAGSNAISDVAAVTPHVLQASLSAPYSDGFAFVQRLRIAGGWAAVDAALRAPPASTEQILHPDKYAAREPPIPVPAPTFAAVGPGFRAVLDDVIGEQGLRLMLEEWTGTAIAERGAAGWGGDRYVIVRRDDAEGAHSFALGLRMVMDTERDAVELAEILERRFGATCRMRPRIGPIAWQRRARDVVVAAGPYERRGTATTSAGSCAVTGKWIEELLRSGATR